MMPGLYPLHLYRGDTYQWRVVIWLDTQRTQPFDLTNYTVMAEIRRESGSQPVYELICNVYAPPGSTAPNGIEITLPSAVCHNLPDAGIWDLQLTTGGGIGAGPVVATILRGDVTVVSDITDSGLGPHISVSNRVAAGLTAFPKRGVRVA